MIREIVKDEEFLRKKCVKAEKKDYHIVTDLLDTAKQYDSCCGLASNQIGYDKKIVIIRNNDKWIPLINPVIVSKSKEVLEAEEGCMSVTGRRMVYRYKQIQVMYTTLNGKVKKETYSGFVARIIQHETDHLNGILI